MDPLFTALFYHIGIIVETETSNHLNIFELDWKFPYAYKKDMYMAYLSILVRNCIFIKMN